MVSNLAAATVSWYPGPVIPCASSVRACVLHAARATHPTDARCRYSRLAEEQLAVAVAVVVAVHLAQLRFVRLLEQLPHPLPGPVKPTHRELVIYEIAGYPAFVLLWISGILQNL